MLVKGDLKCLHCGHTSGEWVGQGGAPLTIAGLRGSHPERTDPDALIRCFRCTGPVFLDDAAAVVNSYRLARIRRLRAQLAALESPRRPAAA